MHRQLDEKSQELLQRLVLMGRLSESMIDASLKMLIQRKEHFAAEVFEKEREVNELQIKVDEQATGRMCGATTKPNPARAKRQVHGACWLPEAVWRINAMSRATVLAIDDEKDLIELVRYNLEKEGFDVVPAMDGESGLRVALQHRPDVILLDLMLPGMDGLEVCRLLRADERTKGVPLIMLTAKAGEADRVIGLELGADDYVTKPFSPRELVARIKAVLRRVSTRAAKGDVKSVGRVMIDPVRHEVTCQGRLIELTATEFRILNVLGSNVGKVFTRDEIIDAVLGEEAAVMDRTVDVHILSLRRKMGEHGRYIRTVRGVGYKLDAGSDDAVGDEAA